MMRFQWTRRTLRSESGQALVEFALVVVLLLILLIGVIEFGRAWNAHQVLTDVAREGARRAVVYDPDITQDSVLNAMRRSLASASFDPDDVTITFPDGFKPGSGEVTTVRVSMPYRFTFLRALIAFATEQPDGTITLVTEARMRTE